MIARLHLCYHQENNKASFQQGIRGTVKQIYNNSAGVDPEVKPLLNTPTLYTHTGFCGIIFSSQFPEAFLCSTILGRKLLFRCALGGRVNIIHGPLAG
jgi:hypothetical protein